MTQQLLGIEAAGQRHACTACALLYTDLWGRLDAPQEPHMVPPPPMQEQQYPPPLSKLRKSTESIQSLRPL